MTYTLHYHDESGNVTPKQAAQIVQFLADWQANDTTPSDGSNRFGGVAYDHDRDGLRVTAYVEGIPETKAPSGIKSDFDPLVSDANSQFNTDFALPSDAASINQQG